MASKAWDVAAVWALQVPEVAVEGQRSTADSASGMQEARRERHTVDTHSGSHLPSVRSGTQGRELRISLGALHTTFATSGRKVRRPGVVSRAAASATSPAKSSTPSNHREQHRKPLPQHSSICYRDRRRAAGRLARRSRRIGFLLDN